MKNSDFNLLIFNIWAVGFIVLPHDAPTLIRALMLLNASLGLIFYLSSLWFDYRENKFRTEMIDKINSNIEQEIKDIIEKIKAKEQCEDHPEVEKV